MNRAQRGSFCFILVEESVAHNKRLLWLLFVVVMLIGATVACSATDSEASLIVINETNQEICAVFISPSSVEDWGDSWLGSDTIPSGTSYTISGIEPGTYDLMAETCAGDFAERFGEDLQTDTEWTLTDQ